MRCAAARRPKCGPRSRSTTRRRCRWQSKTTLASEALEAEDEARELRAAIAQLSPSDRLFMDYYYVQELEPEVIARLMSISVNTVYSRKNKIREKLRTIVGKQHGGSTRKGEAPRA